MTPPPTALRLAERVAAAIEQADVLAARSKALLVQVAALRDHPLEGVAMSEWETARAEAVDVATSASTLAEEVRQIQQYGRRSRAGLIVVAVSVGFDLLLSVALGYVGVKANSTAREANSAKRAAQIQCEASNEASAKQLALWAFAFGLAAEPASPEEQARLDLFRAKLDETFAAQDCGPPP